VREHRERDHGAEARVAIRKQRELADLLEVREVQVRTVPRDRRGVDVGAVQLDRVREARDASGLLASDYSRVFRKPKLVALLAAAPRAPGLKPSASAPRSACARETRRR
jgi:hypothetical protein